MSTILSNRITTQALQSLQSNPASKLLFVNLAGIVLPRIYIDFHRNKYAGQETAFYELYSTATNYALPGALGLGTAYLLGKVNNRFGIKTTNWLDNQYINALSDTYQKSIKPGQHPETQKEFIAAALKKLQVKHHDLAHDERLQPTQIKHYVERIQPFLQKNKLDNSHLKKIALNLAEDLGSFDQIKWGEHSSLSVHPEKLVEHLYILNREFQKGHIGTNLNQIQENIVSIAQKLHFTNTFKSLVSVGIVAGLGFGAQFINKWITQRRTGKSGFVGYSDFETNGASAQIKKSKPKGRTEQNPFPFYNPNSGIYKPTLPAGALYNPFQSPIAASQPNQSTPVGIPPYLSIQTTNRSHNNTGQPVFSGLASSQFLPTAEQLKYVIYPAGIIGKLAASRCLDEFRETATKGGFAYINFLLLPNLVENLVALGMKNSHAFSYSPPKNPPNASGMLSKLKYGYQLMSKTKVRSYPDIGVYAKQVGQRLAPLNEAQIRDGLKGIVRNVEPFMQKLARTEQAQWTDHIAAYVGQELNRVKNIASICGLLYSCLTLGVGLNLLNIYITNRRRAKLHEVLPKPSVPSPVPSRSLPVWASQNTLYPFNTQSQPTAWGFPQFTA